LKDIELSKVNTDNGVSCYLTALNRSNAQEPSTIPSTAPTPVGPNYMHHNNNTNNNNIIIIIFKAY